MDNATRALMMGAGVLIAVLTIGLVVLVMNSMSDTYTTQYDIQTAQQISAFNQEYESYNKKLLRGADVISVCNKAINNNEKYYDIPERRIVIRFKMKETVIYKLNANGSGVGTTKQFRAGGQYTMDDCEEIKGDQEAFDDFKRRIFNCTGVSHNNLGYVSEMTFEEQLIDYTEGL